jgi:hypothetical protein
VEELRPFQYWTLWMAKRHTVTLHHIITLYNDIFDHIEGVMCAFVKEMSQWKEDLYFDMKVAHQKLSKYYAKVTAMTSLLLI